MRQTRSGAIEVPTDPAESPCAGGTACAGRTRGKRGRIRAMRRKWRALALIVVATSALYLAGTAVMTLTPPPWGWVWTLPLACVAALLLRLAEQPARRRDHRRYRGQCERCAYDLRATPHRCPECGRSTW